MTHETQSVIHGKHTGSENNYSNTTNLNIYKRHNYYTNKRMDNIPGKAAIIVIVNKGGVIKDVQI